MKKLWVRTCQECGHQQQAHKPDVRKDLTVSYEFSKCRKCGSEGSLDYGKEILIPQTPEERNMLESEDDDA